MGDDDLLSALNDDMGDGFEGMSGFDDIFMTWPETDPVNDGGDDLTSDITGLCLISFRSRNSSYSFIIK